MASQDDELCQVNLHMTPLQKSHGAQELVEAGVTLPSWIQHWAIIFLWEQSDRALRVEGIEEEGKCEVKVREMSYEEGLQQPGTKVECGVYPLTIEQVKDVAAQEGASPPDYDELTASCQTTAQKVLASLGVNIDTQGGVETALCVLQRLGGEDALEKLQAALKDREDIAAAISTS